MPLLNLRMLQPEVLISINDCRELSYVRDEGADIVCGALTRQIEVERSALVQRDCPLLSLAALHIGGMANRNRGTVCGSLAHADPLAELPAVALALDATFIIHGNNGRRNVAASDFFLSELSTCIEPGEMLEAVRFPKKQLGEVAAFMEIGNRRHGFAIAGVAAQIDLDGNGVCRGARLAAMGAGSVARRLVVAEQVLLGQRLQASVIEAAAAAAFDEAEPPSDIHADSVHRKHLARTLLSRVVTKIAAEQARK